MATRPDAVGSPRWLIRHHGCWRRYQPARASRPTHAIIRERGRDAEYVGGADARRALEHVFYGHHLGLEVVAFCP